MGPRNKKIEKITKNTRSSKKKNYEIDSEHELLYSASKLFGRGKELPKQKLKFLEPREIKHTSEHDQSIVINLDLGKYGFDRPLLRCSFGRVEELLQNLSIFSANPNSFQIEWANICNQVSDRLEKACYLLQAKNNYALFEGSQKLIEINRNEAKVWQFMHELFTKFKQGHRSPGLTGVISDIVDSMQSKFVLSNQKIQIFNQHLQEKIEKSKDVESQLQSQVAYKTFLLGLNDFAIDELNYFLIKEFEENSRVGKLQNKIQNWEDWSKFIQKKRVRLRKANKFILHTSCQLCLSPYFQQFNPIINCPQCHARGHRLCLGLDRLHRCGRCIYLRLSNSLKSQISECFLCQTKNLVPIRVSSNKFAHAFCLFANNLWNIKSSGVHFKDSCIASCEVLSKQEKICKYCNQISQYFTQCQTCLAPVHYLCAYMNGAGFETSMKKLIVNCCPVSTNVERLAYQRKFILNYNNSVFRHLACVMQSMKKRKRTKMRAIQKQEQDAELAEANINLNLLSEHYENQYKFEQRIDFSSNGQLQSEE